jgi:site-specific DNA recombinase
VKGQLVPHPQEAPVRRLIYELYAEHRRKRTVARLLTDAGHRTRKGGAFTPLTIERLIRDPTAKGLHRRNYTTRSPDNKATLYKPEADWEYTEVEPVVSEELWERCNAILKENWRPQKRPAKRAVQLFAGLVFCGQCSSKMYVPSNTPKYVCQKCRTKIPKGDLETVFREQLRAFFLSPEDLARHLEEGDEQLSARTELLDQLTREQQKVAREMEKTHKLYLEDAISADGFKRLYRPLEDRAEQLTDEIPRLQAEVDFLRMQNLSRDEIAAQGMSLFERWSDLEYGDRRAVVEAIVQRIEINGDEIRIELCYLPPPVEEVANGAHTPRTSCRRCSEFIRPKRPRGTPTRCRGHPRRASSSSVPGLHRLRVAGRGRTALASRAPDR